MLTKLNGREVEFELSLDEYSDSAICAAHFVDTGLDLTDEEIEQLGTECSELIREIEIEEGVYRD